MVDPGIFLAPWLLLDPAYGISPTSPISLIPKDRNFTQKFQDIVKLLVLSFLSKAILSKMKTQPCVFWQIQGDH